MEGYLLMSRKELGRKSVLELVQAKRLALVEASERMYLSYRQTLRVFARFSAEGDAGLVRCLSRSGDGAFVLAAMRYWVCSAPSGLGRDQLLLKTAWKRLK